jgi:hypothetical protein
VSSFDFFFSLFGLILGLSVAVVISGMTDILRERHRLPIGWLTPMLGLALLFDLTTQWVNTWTGLRSIDVAYGPFVAAMIVAGSYFFAASMAFPKTPSEWPSLDDYYLKNYRFVIGGVFLANFGVAVMTGIIDQSFAIFLRAFIRSGFSIVFWLTLVAMLIIPRRGFQLVGLGIILALALYALIALWHPR